MDERNDKKTAVQSGIGEIKSLPSSVTLDWKGTPPPKVLSASNPERDGIDFREFCVDGENLTDYTCSTLQVIVSRTKALKLRGLGMSDFTDAPISKISSSICVPGERVQFEWSGKGRFLGIYLPPSFIEKAFERPFQSMVFSTDKLRSRSLEHLLMAIRADIRQGSHVGPVFMQSAAISILRCLLVSPGGSPSASKGGLSRRQCVRLESLINEEFSGQLTLGRLSREVGLSAGHLSRAFKISMGLSPHRYIIRVRVARAKQLILTTSWSLEEIAEAVGFADASHLSTVFLKVTGRTPSQFRNG